MKAYIKIQLFFVFALLPGLGVYPQTKLEHHINALATQVSDNGSLLYRRSDILQTTWPYYSRYFDMTARKNYQESWGVWLGVKDFLGVNDTLPENTVVGCGNFSVDYSSITPLSLLKRVKYPYPVIKVSDGKTTNLEVFDASTVVPSLLCDEQIESVWTTALGITVQLKTYAFASTGQKNYIIYDYRFINTGNIDSDTKTKELNSKLKGVWFGFPFSTDIKPKFGGKDYDDYYQYYGAGYPDWVKGNKQSDSARVLYCWDGPDGTGDYEPDPLTKEPRTPGYYGVGILHVDKQAVDDLEFGASDDPAQPKVVTTGSSLVTSGVARYQNLSQGGAQNISGMGAENLMIGCGPYDIPINEDVNIVLVQIIDGISPTEAKQLGMKLLSGAINKEQYDKIISTGKDSLFKSFSAARQAYNKSYKIPFPPPSPDTLIITSGVGQNILRWSANAESSTDPITKKKDFSGYRVYRAAITPDNQWEKLSECGGKTGVPVTNSFIDSSLVLGFNYYYAVTSYDDGTQNTFNPGVSLESSMLTSTAYLGVSASRPAQETSSDFQNNLRVVPNPYNIRSRNFGDPNDPSSVENNKLLFVGLPAKCTIRIYTVSGDLVKIIEHDNGLGSESWNQISASNQFIKSGLYIAQIESPLGNAIIKFVVIR